MKILCDLNENLVASMTQPQPLEVEPFTRIDRQTSLIVKNQKQNREEEKKEKKNLKQTKNCIFIFFYFCINYFYYNYISKRVLLLLNFLQYM